MKTSLKIFAWLFITFWFSGTLAAQEKTLPSQATREAPTTLQGTANVVGKAVGTKPVPRDTKSVTANAEDPLVSEKKAEEPAAPPIFTPGRRDPFRPFTLNVRSSPARRRDNLSPLERYELGQLKLVAVIWDVREPSAMVEDAGGLGYRVKVGTPIGLNDGKIKSIQRDGIVVEEFYLDLYGAKKKREVNLRLSVESAG
ncbi:MAG TPA: pilus assembly protein PilP [Methylomirabilota bacterium]|nr:pilus assembly protein PilP [Methylomirabilota bacterium]